MPQRRCVGCGRVAPKSELLRLAASDSGPLSESGKPRLRAVLDRTGTLPGRGAYLCRALPKNGPRADCVTLATRRGGLARALRCAVKIDPEFVESISGWRSQPSAGEPGRVGPDKDPIIR